MTRTTADLEVELLLARMKAVQHESSLLKDVVRLQRMRIEQLERQLVVEKQLRRTRLNLREWGVCRNCGLNTPSGAVFCKRDCFYEFHAAKTSHVAAR